MGCWAPGVVLVLDGLFLHRDELHDPWELSVFLDVPFNVPASRAGDCNSIWP